MRHWIVLATTVLLLAPTSVYAYRIPNLDEWQAFTLSLINASRQEFGFLALGIDEDLNDLSDAHAKDTVTSYDDSTHELRRSTYLRHVSSDGRELPDRVQNHGITGAERFGENVGLRYRLPFTDLEADIEEAITFLHTAMMAEEPPR